MEIEIVPSVLKTLPVFIRPTSPRTLGQTCPFHIHDEVELLRVTKGFFLFKTSEQAYYLKPGDIIFIQSRTPHYTENLEEDSDTQLIMFPYEHFAENTAPVACQCLSRFLNAEKALSAVFRADDPETKELSQCFDRIIAEMGEKKPAYELYIKTEISAIIAFLSRHNVMPDTSSFLNEHDVNRVLPILEYINTNYYRRISLEEISSVLNLNVSYVCRLFKKATGSPFVEYLNFVRICKTEALLVSSPKNIAEIAFDTGFSSTSYFNSIFKKFKGCTPTEFRRSKYQQTKPPQKKISSKLSN